MSLSIISKHFELSEDIENNILNFMSEDKQYYKKIQSNINNQILKYSLIKYNILNQKNYNIVKYKLKKIIYEHILSHNILRLDIKIDDDKLYILINIKDDVPHESDMQFGIMRVDIVKDKFKYSIHKYFSHFTLNTMRMCNYNDNIQISDDNKYMIYCAIDIKKSNDYAILKQNELLLF